MSEIEKIIDDVKIAFMMWDSEYGIGDKEWENMNTAINILKNSADHNGWISVKDRLPEEKEHVLIWIKDLCIIIDWIVNGKWVVSDEIVTHWMPLPEPPTEDGNESD